MNMLYLQNVEMDSLSPTITSKWLSCPLFNPWLYSFPFYDSFLLDLFLFLFFGGFPLTFLNILSRALTKRSKMRREREEGGKKEQWVLLSLLNWFLELPLISKVAKSEKRKGLGNKKSTVLES